MTRIMFKAYCGHVLPVYEDGILGYQKTIIMQTVITSSEISNFVVADLYTTTAKSRVSPVTTFIHWCEGQEESRMLWLALTFLGLIGLAVPCTLTAILMFAGNNFGLWIAVCVINVPVMAISLAAQPTKITIPALFAAWALDLSIILFCVAYFVMH